MNDHNLDDLIIDNIEPKNSKTKSFLTIIALLIVVLIVAIILTKTILKNPEADRLALEESSTELISPELTLQNTTNAVKKEEPKEEPTVIAKPSISKPVEEKVAPTTVTIDKELSQKSKEIEKVEKTTKTEEITSNPKTLTMQSSSTTQAYYIQVGSFTKNPSAQFLSIIKNSGFNYKITDASSSGTKKLLIGPYEDQAVANTALVRVKDRINKSAFVIKK